MVEPYKSQIAQFSELLTDDVAKSAAEHRALVLSHAEAAQLTVFDDGSGIWNGLINISSIRHGITTRPVAQACDLDPDRIEKLTGENIVPYTLRMSVGSAGQQKVDLEVLVDLTVRGEGTRQWYKSKPKPGFFDGFMR
jgi:hypothetical protein